MKQLKHYFALTLATGGGIGFSPVAPGTAGTLIAVPIFICMKIFGQRLEISTGFPEILFYSGCTIMFFQAGIWSSNIATVYWQQKDPGKVVIDEITGYLITMMVIPLEWIWIIIGFILFRCLDIAKIWPASWADKKISGGLGIMLDDAISGIQGALLLNIVYWIIFKW